MEEFTAKDTDAEGAKEMQMRLNHGWARMGTDKSKNKRCASPREDEKKVGTADEHGCTQIELMVHTDDTGGRPE